LSPFAIGPQKTTLVTAVLPNFQRSKMAILHPTKPPLSFDDLFMTDVFANDVRDSKVFCRIVNGLPGKISENIARETQPFTDKGFTERIFAVPPPPFPPFDNRLRPEKENRP
jgi:hypothetical protein